MDDFQQQKEASSPILKEVKDSEQSQIIREERSFPDIGSRYEIKELIGEGGMGCVYKVVDTSQEKIFAVKVMKPELVLDPSARHRFEQEIESVTRLSHSNVVSIYDFDTAGDGSPFLVMDYIEGESLDKYLKREGKAPSTLALSIISQVCEALIDAHNLGIIHRDLKPSNIILQKSSGGEIIAKLVDFGIAKIETEDQESATLTQTGVVIGSPLYASPEQCQGNPHDERSDIYSLGCILYELLAGTNPFNAPNVVKIILNQINKTAEPLSADKIDVPPDKVADLNLMLTKCLAKDPQDRYEAVREILDDIQSLNENKRLKRASSIKNWINEVLKVPPEPRRINSILLWWELRRLIYNVVVGLTGLVGVLVLVASGLATARLTPEIVIMGILAYGFMANVCYSLGFFAELTARFFLKKKAENIGPLLFFLGLLFSVALTAITALGAMV